MPASIFNGTAVKILKSILRTKSNIEIITGDANDPTVVAKNAPASSLYLRSGTGELYIKTDAGASTNWSLLLSSSSAANRTLSNLTSPVALNQDLLFSAPDLRSIGSATSRALSMHSDEFRLYNSNANTSTILGPAVTTPSGSTADSLRSILFLRKLAIFTGNDSNADANATSNLLLESGNKTAGTGNSGDIIATVGTSSGGTRGKIRLKDGSEGTSGYVWTSTDTTGGGTWAAASGSGANTTLSNLTSPTSINQNLLPDITSTKDLGSSSLRFNAIYGTTADISTSVLTGQLNVDNLRIDGNTLSSTNVNGDIIIDPNGTGSVDVNTSKIINVTDPTVAQGAATKNYVDSNAANRTLSNLTSPLAMQQDLKFDVADTRSIGSSISRALSIHSDEFRLYDSSSTVVAIFSPAATTPSGVTADILRDSVNARRIAIHTANNGTVDAAATADTLIETGNKTAGTGNSGAIKLQTGTSAGGARGEISLNGSQVNANNTKIINVIDPTAAQHAATKNYVDSNAVNRTLSNLTSPTSINKSLIFQGPSVANGFTTASNSTTPSISGTDDLGDWTFIFSADQNIVQGDVYSNNGFNFTVTTPTSLSPYLRAPGNSTDIPSNGGTLTRVSGTGPASISFINAYFDMLSLIFNPGNNNSSQNQEMHTGTIYMTGGDDHTPAFSGSKASDFSFNAGTSDNNSGGNFYIAAGSNNNNNGTGGIIQISGGQGISGGGISIIGGPITSGSNPSEPINIQSGDNNDLGDTGDINLTCGTPASGAQGRVVVSARSVRFPQFDSDPTGISGGEVYYNTISNKLKLFNGATWETITST